MSEQKYSVLKLRLSLNLEETDVKDRVVLNRYGKVKQGIIREILVPADITLHALHYVIQRALDGKTVIYISIFCQKKFFRR